MEYVYEVSNVIPKSLCDEIIEKFENDPDKRPGLTSAGLDEKIKKTTDLIIYNEPEWKVINDKLERYLFTAITEYFEYLIKDVYDGDDNIIVGLFGNGIDITNFQMQRYTVGDYFTLHVDHQPERLLTFIIYLNENGGHTNFLNGKNVKPEPGKILFFPSVWTYPHRGCKIENGTKYIITGFFVQNNN